MKHLLNGVAIVAALAIAVPALAQAQTAGARPARPKAPAMSRASVGHGPIARAPRAGSRTIARASRSPSDNVANQLNGQELQRLEGGPAPAAMTAPRPAMEPGPRVSGSGNIRPGVSGPVSGAPGTAEEGPRVSGGGSISAPTGPLPMPPPPPIAAPTR
jgi:hypothetical protein